MMTTDSYIKTKREILAGSGKMERVIPLEIERILLPAIVNNSMRAVPMPYLPRRVLIFA
jgi:hypothetical protein